MSMLVASPNHTASLIHGHIRDRQLKGVNGVTIFAVQGPGYALVQRLDRCLGLLGNVSHDGVDHLALVVSLLALDDIFGRNTSF